MDQPTNRVRQLRVVVEADDYDEAVRFFRDVLGMPEQAAFAEGDEDRVAILEAGVATLEIASPAHKRAIDAVEAGGQISPHIRLAFEVEDATSTTATLAQEGGTVVAEPIETPWRSLNSRLDAPAGLQITLFQELESADERTAREGFALDH